jgi:hypothetical protein
MWCHLPVNTALRKLRGGRITSSRPTSAIYRDPIQNKQKVKTLRENVPELETA